MTLAMPETAKDAEGNVWTQRPDGGWTTTPPLPEPPATAAEALARAYAEYGKPAIACRAFVLCRMPPWASSKEFLWPLEPRHRWELLDRIKEVLRTHKKAHTEFIGLPTALIHRLLKEGLTKRSELTRRYDADVMRDLGVGRKTLAVIRSVVPIDPDVKWNQELVECPHCEGSGMMHPSQLTSLV